MISNMGYSQETVLFASDAFVNAKLGVSVAATNDIFIVGAWNGNQNITLGGAVYVFKKNGAVWIEEAKLIPSDPSSQQEFALHSIAINGDYILVGAYNYLGLEDDQKGAAYVFKKEDDQWLEQAKLTPTDRKEKDAFGRSVVLFQDYAIIGAQCHPVNGIGCSGAAYIFKREGDEWIEQKKLIPSDPVLDAFFGNAVSMNEDFAFVSAPNAKNNGIASGAVYVFKKDGQDWIEETKLFSSDIPSNNTDFGYSIDVQAETVLIGTGVGEMYNGYERGTAYVYTYNGFNWIEESRLVPTDLAEEDKEGRDVSLFGNQALISLNGDHNTGRIYLFEKEGNEWQQKNTIVSSNVSNYDQYGSDVALSEDYIFTGAFNNSSSGMAGAGAAYVYELDLIPTSIEVASLETSIQVYPNPINNFLTVLLKSGVLNETSNLKIYDINGRLISVYPNPTKNGTDNLWEVNTMFYPSGTYILQVKGPDQIYTSKFVKM